MSKFTILSVVFFLIPFASKSQENQSGNLERGLFTNMEWTQNDTLLILPQFWMYIDEFYFEWRYNYEDINTLTMYIGRPFSHGEKLIYEIVPMAGISFGQTLGISFGLKLFAEYKGLSFVSEGQLTCDLKRNENSFIYNRSDLSYWVTHHIGIGIAHQVYAVFTEKTKHVEGPMLSFSFNEVELQFAVLDFSKHEMSFYLGIGYTLP
ncbi:MAG TPA: hypothetical protein PLU49_15035 [Saprospiraceae bacterium]|nr:hypothetical protein [Saprospiraceae bacterium]